jgi:hypothetical protein
MRIIAFAAALALSLTHTLSVESNIPMNICVPEDADDDFGRLLPPAPAPALDGRSTRERERARDNIATRQRLAQVTLEAAEREMAEVNAVMEKFSRPTDITMHPYKDSDGVMRTVHTRHDGIPRISSSGRPLREDLAIRQRQARDAMEAATREITAIADAAAAAEAAVAAAEAAAAVERQKMAQLLVRLLVERLLYIPELDEFDLPHSIDVTEMPSKIVEALVTYGPYKVRGDPTPYAYKTAKSPMSGGLPVAPSFDKIYLAFHLDPWKPLIEAATARRRL